MPSHARRCAPCRSSAPSAQSLSTRHTGRAPSPRGLRPRCAATCWAASSGSAFPSPWPPPLVSALRAPPACNSAARDSHLPSIPFSLATSVGAGSRPALQECHCILSCSCAVLSCACNDRVQAWPNTLPRCRISAHWNPSLAVIASKCTGCLGRRLYGSDKFAA